MLCNSSFYVHSKKQVGLTYLFSSERQDTQSNASESIHSVQTVGAVGRSFGPVQEGIRCFCPQRVSQLVSTQHHWVDIFILQRKGSHRWKGSTVNSTATCSTWRGMGSVRLYLARDSQCDENKQLYHTGSVAALVSPQQGPRLPPYTRTEVSSMLLVRHLRFVEETTSP